MQNNIPKKKIKLYFVDFYPNFVLQNNYFYDLISREYLIILDQNNPDFLIYSSFGFDHLKYNCTKIYYTGENDTPNFNICDYALSFMHIEFGDRHFRLPNFVTYFQHKTLFDSQDTIAELASKNRFCNFIVSSSNGDPIREQFFNALSTYKKVDSPGKFLNNNLELSNNSDWAYSKLDFMKKYKFSIVFENSSISGYTTEKLMHAFLANTIPIYWGNPDVYKDFNTNSFINFHDYNSIESVVKKVIEIDNNDEKYLEMINTNKFNNQLLPDFFDDEKIMNFLKNIFDKQYHLSKRIPKYGYLQNYVDINFKSKISHVERGFIYSSLKKIKRALYN
jgi:hypothetical protein